MKTTRTDITEALKVPVLMGRGEVYAIFMGVSRWLNLVDYGDDSSFSVQLFDTGVFEGRPIVILINHSNVLFAVTEDEYEGVLQKLKDEEEEGQPAQKAAG